MATKGTGERAALRVARNLVTNISKQGLRPGAQLQPEHEMVEQFGVARGTMREALRFLELHGALRIKAGPGGGPIVSVPGADHLASLLSLHLQFADATFRSVIDARRVLHPAIAAEAARNATVDDVIALHECVARLHDTVGDNDRYVIESRRFHSLIAVGSKNRVLALLVDAIQRMCEGMEMGVWGERQHLAAVQTYADVVDAIAQGDEDAARGLMERSFASAMRTWERTAPEDLARQVSWTESANVLSAPASASLNAAASETAR